MVLQYNRNCECDDESKKYIETIKVKRELEWISNGGRN